MKTSSLKKTTLLLCAAWLCADSARAATPGAVAAWGYNDYGQTTVPMIAQSGVTAIAGGGHHTVALKNDGRVVAWGNNTFSQTTVPVAAQSGVTAIAAGDTHTLALKSNGSVVAWGNNASGQSTVPVAAQSGVIAVAAGGFHTAALKNDGSVVAWGYNDYGQTTVPVAAQSEVTAIAAGAYHTVALKSDGSVLAWGWNSNGQTNVPATAQSGVIAVAAGYGHAVVLKNDGRVVAWGNNDYGQTNVPVAAQSGVAAIAAGYFHTVALKNDGSMVAWGRSDDGQTTVPPAAQSGLVAIAAGAYHTVTIVLPTAPAIIWQPVSQTVNAGQSAAFTVVATGYPVYYQWRKDANDLSGATNATYIIFGVQPADAAGYSVVVSNRLGMVTSAPPAVLTVNAEAPTGSVYISIGQSPALAGTAVQLCASVSGFPSPSVQWQFEGTNLPVANSYCLYFPSIQTNQVGSYRLVASNFLGSFTSAPVALVVTQAAPTASIRRVAGSSAPPAGSAVQLCATISGGPVPSLQWQLNGVNLPGENGGCLYLSNMQSNQSGSYRLVASNELGVVASAPIVLAVTYAPPSGVIFFDSGQSPAPAGYGIGICSSMAGAPPPAYQWQFRGTNLPGQNDSCLYINNLSSNQAGLYRLVASNVLGVFTSAPISLAVNFVAPTGSIYFSNGASPTPAGSSVLLTAAITSAPPAALQWQFNGTNLSGQNFPSLQLFNVSSNEFGLYRLVANNVAGSFTSAPLALAVSYFAPTGSIFFNSGQSPASAGSSVSLCGSIFGGPPVLGYQWRLNGVDLPGQGGSSCLSLGNLSSNQAGSYQLFASNSVGGFTSAPIALAVNYSAPSGFITPSGVLPPTLAGNSLTICATISGAPTANLQWQFNGVNLPGRNASCLDLINLQTNQSGSYRLIASNSVGSFTSADAVVSVVHAPPVASIFLSSGHTPTIVSSSVTLCSSVSGAPLPALQWRFNGTNLTDQTNGCLNLINVQTNQSGSYTLVASNALGVVTSAVAMITVLDVPVLAYFAYSPPPVAIGFFQHLCAETFLPGPATFQWRLNGTNLVDVTNACFEIYPVQESDAGDYSVVATAASGSYTSSPIALTVYVAPPHGATAYFYQGGAVALAGGDVGLGVSYAGSPSFFQWRFNDADLPGQTNVALALLGISTNQAGDYSFTATNLAGATTSSVVTITVNYQAPSFTYQPSSLSIAEGGTARFTATATAGPPPDYFLEQNGTNVPVPYTYDGYLGGFTLFDTAFADAGNYRVIASNVLGSVTSTVAALNIKPAGPLDRWTQRNPLPQSQPLLHVAHGSNQFVAVGERGTILTSPDGSNWALQSRRADVPLKGAAYGGGVFVAVGDGGTILSSSDGTNWAYRSTASGTFLNGVTYAAGRFVVVGSAPGLSTLVMHSTNGLDWDRVAVSGFSAYQCVSFGNGLFVAAGSSIMVSTDGINWGFVRNVSKLIESITYANGLYVAVGDDGSMLVSTNASTWLTRTPVTTKRLLGVTYGAGRFVAVGARGTVLTSTDTSIWSAAAPGTADRLETIDFSGELFVAAGENGIITTSTNGTSWTQQSFGPTRDLDGMAVGNGLLMAVGKGGSIITSPNGVQFAVQNAGVTNDLHGVTWGGGIWVAVGEPGIVLTSPNAVNWTSHNTGTTNSLKDVIYADGQWLAVGTHGTLVRSTDGTNWTSASVGLNRDLNALAHGNGVFLVAGDGPNDMNGSLFRSLDGINWTVANVFFGKNLRGITFANGQFVISANDGALYTTSAGATFGYHPPFGVIIYGRNLRAATWAQGLWTVVGNNGTIITSPDLATWTPRASRTFENQHQVAFLDGHLVVIGNRGGVLQSGRFVAELEPPVLVPGTGFRLPFKGVVNQVYQVQASTDLANWIEVLTFTNLVEHSELTDTNALHLPQRFYRLVEP